MVKRKIILGLIILSLIFVSGFEGCYYMSSPPKIALSPSSICVNECLKLKNQSMELNSQCLLDPIPNTELVCDVAHNPRTAEDDLKENQCDSWNNKTARHFVEVTPECDFIRFV